MFIMSTFVLAREKYYLKICLFYNLLMTFHCAECNIKYKTISGLIKHKNKYHILDKDAIKNYECKHCRKSFSFNQSRWVHQKTCQIKNTKLILIN